MSARPRDISLLQRIALLAILGIGVAFVKTGTTFAATVHVGNDGRYSTITDGVAAAADGDTVLISPGVYFERGIVVDRAITLLGSGHGADRPVIDGRSEGEILTITSDGVRVDNVILRNVGTSFMEDRAAVRLSSVSGCVVTRCRIENAFFAVYGEEASECAISDNEIAGEAVRESTSGNGVHLWYCKTMTVARNTVSGHRDGIYLEFVQNCTIRDNTSTRNLRYGLHFMFSHDNTYTSNRFVDNGAGVAVMYSDRVTMDGNHFERNWGTSAYGLLLKDIRDSHIVNNRFTRNTIGLYSEGSNRLDVSGNDFVENGYGIRVMANSSDNVFTANNFIRNSFDVATNSRQNFNQFHSNYWSEYRGYDLNRDGVGDVPHHPVRVFALIVENQPPGMLLMSSLFVHILDTAERIMPVLTPITLVDDTPLLKKVAR